MTAQARCALLGAQSRAALQRHREESERVVQALVLQRRDPLARRRDSSGDAGAVDVRGPDTLVSDHVRRQLPGVERAPNNPHELALAPGDVCAPYAGGAWGFVITSAQSFPAEPNDWSQPWTGGALVALAHVDANGAISTNADIHTSMDQGTDRRPPEAWPEQPSRWNCCNNIAGTWEHIVRYDFDHDEVPELFLSSYLQLEGSRYFWSGLFTFRDGRIAPYPTPTEFPLRAVRDANGDGRPDLIGAREVAAGVRCGSGYTRNEMTPEFVAIARPDGTFDHRGPEAIAAALRWCPSRPQAIDSFSKVLCARLWGESVEALRAMIRCSFSAWNCDDQERRRPQRNRRSHEDYDAMLAALTVAMPLSLEPRSPADAGVR